MRILYLIFNLIIIFKLINSYSYTSIQYENKNCGGRIITISSSTLCSPLGRFKYLDNSTVEVTYANEISSIEECESVTVVNTKQTLNQCQDNQFKFFLSQENPVALAEGFCGAVTTFNSDCSYLQLTSYITGACAPIDNNSWYRYVCDGTTVQRYTCTKDCSEVDNLSSCTFESNLPGIETCNIEVKPISEITDGAVDSSDINNSNKLINSISVSLILLIILSILL